MQQQQQQQHSLLRKRTRQDMHLHGMISSPQPSSSSVVMTGPNMVNYLYNLAERMYASNHQGSRNRPLPPQIAPAAVPQSGGEHGLLHYVNEMYMDVYRQLFPAARPPPPAQQQQPPAAAARSDVAEQYKNDRRQLANYVQTFIPCICGGSMENCCIRFDPGYAPGQLRLMRSSGGTDEEFDSVVDWMATMNEGNVYRVLPGGIIISMKMLLALIRWPPLLGASDESLFFLAINLQTPRVYFGDLCWKRMNELTQNGLSMHVCGLFYHLGEIFRSCLSVLRVALTLNLQARDAESVNGTSRDPNLEDLPYEIWISKLWDVLPDIHKLTGQSGDSGTVQQNLQQQGIQLGLISSRAKLEYLVRNTVLPTNNHSISHLVLKTAWDDGSYTYDGTSNESTLRKAQQLDLFYATMVKGACIQVPLTPHIWCPHDEMEHTGLDTDNFFRSMWKGLDDIAAQWHSGIHRWTSRMGIQGAASARRRRRQQQQQGASNNNDDDDDDAGSRLDDMMQSADVVEISRRMKHIKRVMKEVWEESKSYRVSDHVHMTEKQLLTRLRCDGALPQYEDAGLAQRKKLDPLHVCFFFRRHEVLRNQFAAAVGKRMVTERTNASNKSAIIEHHRTVRWSEREYGLLFDLVQNNSSMIAAQISRFDADNPGPYFLDYARILTGNVQYTGAEMAEASLMGGGGSYYD